MNSEKTVKKQQAVLVEIVQRQMEIFNLNCSSSKEITISIPGVPNINQENIKPIFYEALGYIPEIKLFQKLSINADINSVSLFTIIIR